jgi:glyoxylase-like metal-dependent hydrolase (beta-lactamase superfamily II)
VLVETDEGRILWDTSCPRDWEERWGRPPAGLLSPTTTSATTSTSTRRLNQVASASTQIDMVILSHLHFDHAGNANMFKGTNAKLVCNEKERDFAFASTGCSPART